MSSLEEKGLFPGRWRQNSTQSHLILKLCVSNVRPSSSLFFKFLFLIFDKNKVGHVDRLPT